MHGGPLEAVGAVGCGAVKVRLDENIPASEVPLLAALGHDVETVTMEGLLSAELVYQEIRQQGDTGSRCSVRRFVAEVRPRPARRVGFV